MNISSFFRISYIESDRFVRLAIVEHFTLADGSNSLYVGREKFLTSIAGLPVPHDAPYKPQIDRFLMMVIEVSCREPFSTAWIASTDECTYTFDTNAHTFARVCTLYVFVYFINH